MVTASAETPQLSALIEAVTVAVALSLFPSVANKHLLSVCQYKCLSVAVCFDGGAIQRVITGSQVQSLRTADGRLIQVSKPQVEGTSAHTLPLFQVGLSQHDEVLN